MSVSTPEEIKTLIIDVLASTTLACSDLTPLSGGTANFIFKGKLRKALDDGTTEVVIKHGEGYSASFSSLKLSTDRCVSAVDNLKPPEEKGTRGTHIPIYKIDFGT